MYKSKSQFLIFTQFCWCDKSKAMMLQYYACGRSEVHANILPEELKGSDYRETQDIIKMDLKVMTA
jgi:hypothetical protein